MLFVGLGALSVLRTQSSGGQNFLFRSILSTIMRLSLPPDSVMKEYVSRWGFLSEKEMFTYVDHLSADIKPNFVDDTDYEVSLMTQIFIFSSFLNN